MGVDIHMHIISKEGKYKYQDIFDGRNGEWFDNITGDYRNDFYQNFPLRNGIPEGAPDDIKRFFKGDEFDFYDFFHVNVGEFMDWFEEARPDIDAGWLSTYDMWLYERKKVLPHCLPHELDEDCNPYDYHFMEIENPWDCSRWLYEFINEHIDTITSDDFIVYYFDC